MKAPTAAEKNAGKQNDNMAVALAVIQADIGYIRVDIDEIKALVKDTYVTKEEFDPVKKIVYGLVSAILLAVVVALIALVVTT